MIPDDLEQQILRLHLVEKWLPGTIARQIGVHPGTVDRVLKDHGLEAGKTTARPSMVEPYLPFMHETLKKFPKLPASRLHAMVVERGYPGGSDHFRSIVAKIRPKKPAEAYQRLRTLPAEEAQVDWGHFGKVKVGSAVRVLSAFVMVLSWCRQVFVRFFYDQRIGSFLAGHIAAFEFFGGVARRALYDNLKSVVLSRRGDAIQFNPTLLEFASHYRYEPRPVAPYRGNEKGRVERKIRDLRQSFWPCRQWSDLDDLNQQVEVWCREVVGARRCPEDKTMTVAQAWEEERLKLLALPPDRFPADDRVEVKVGKQPYVRFDRNDYSVPHDRMRRTLTVLATQERIRIVEGADIVAEHPRSFDKGAQVEDPAHLEALATFKARAREQRGMDRLHYAVPSSRGLLEGAASRGHNLGSAVVALLRLVETWGAEAVEEAVVDAIDADALHVAAVRQVLERRSQEAGTPPPIALNLPDDPRVRELHVQPHDLANYDDLREGDDD